MKHATIRFIIGVTITLATVAAIASAGAQPSEEPPTAVLADGGDGGLSEAPPKPLAGEGEEALPPVNQAKEAPAEVAHEVYDRLRSGEWLIAFGGILMFMVWGIRKFLGRWVDWFNTKTGGMVLSFGTAFLLAVGTALFAGEGLSLGLFTAAMGAAWAAAGTWGHAKDVMEHKHGRKPA